jgi:hypothetical protein
MNNYKPLQAISMTKTTLLTDKGFRDVSFDHSKQLWFYQDNNEQVEEKFYPKLSLTFSSSDEYYNAVLLSRITNTPPHFWRAASERLKAHISQVLGRAYDSVKDELLEVRQIELDRQREETRQKMIAKNPKYQQPKK